MKRGAIGLFLGAALVVVLIAATGGSSSGHYKVAALFDNAANLIPGQNVEIAGAVVGQVSSIGLTPDHRALVKMDVQTGFAPFRADASCTIKPQSLIGEKFIECDPGSPDARELPARDGIPTVPLARDHSPVDIDLVFSALRQPYVQRLSLVVNELGTGLAGRPHDLQQAIKRAAPALQQFDHVLGIVDSDRALLGRLIDRTDAVLAQVTPRNRDVTRFIDHASAAAGDVAQRRAALGAALDRLPPLLDQLQPSAASLAGVARDARPVVHELRQATPSLRSLFADLAPLTNAGRPALRALASASDAGVKAAHLARPVAKKLRGASALIPHVGQVAAALTGSLRSQGTVEAINTFAWLGAGSMARYDATSHIIPAYQLTGTCQLYATAPAAGCSAHWPGSKADAASASAQTRAKKPSAHVRRRHHRRHRARRKQGTTQKPGSTTPSPVPAVPQLPLPHLPKVPLPQVPALQPPPSQGPNSNVTSKLLDFLMGK
jgi:virulence factor Mce-like protein